MSYRRCEKSCLVATFWMLMIGIIIMFIDIINIIIDIIDSKQIIFCSLVHFDQKKTLRANYDVIVWWVYPVGHST